MFVVIQKEFYEFGITVRPAEVGRFVERTDTFHIFRCKREIEYIQILFHSLDMRAFRDGDDAALHQVTQGDLLYRFIVSFGQSRQYEMCIRDRL